MQWLYGYVKDAPMLERGPRNEPAHEHETILSQDFVDAMMQAAGETWQLMAAYPPPCFYD